MEPLLTMKSHVFLLIVSFQLLRFSKASSYVSNFYPNWGSFGGGTQITVEGVGFSKNSFNHFPGTEHLGNQVFFVFRHYLFPCDVILEKTTTTRIICVTRAGMPSYYFTIKVTVDGDVIPTCYSGYSNCRYRPHTTYTPTISQISPLSGPQGTLLTIRGQIFTSKYGMNSSTNGDTDDVARVTAGGDICEITSSNGQSNGIILDDSGESKQGVLTCKMSKLGSKIGNLNVSYTLTARGRSKTDLILYRVSRNGQIFMFQSYAEINSVTPSLGSTEGGTVITISGSVFDETSTEAVVKVGGTRCRVITINATTIICKTARKPEITHQHYPGNRGVSVESWKDTHESNLEMVMNLNESASDYQTSFSDTTRIPGYSTSSSYVNRMRGFFYPPFDGQYRFVITSAAGVQFYLSTNTDPANVKLEIDRDIGRTDTTRAILLHSNRSYYMEVLYRQSTSATAVNVAVRHLDSIVNHYMAGNVQQEQQRIRFWTGTENEKQRITIPDIINQTAVHEQQEIIVDADEGRFRLGMYGVYTEILIVGASAIEIRNALQALPVIDASETVSVNMTSHGEGFKYTVTFISERGSFPLLEIRDLSGSIPFEVLKTRDGRPSGKKIGLFMAGTPAPLIDSDPSQAQVEDAIDQLFTARCPAYWTEPKKSVLYYNMDDYSSIPTYMRSKWTNLNWITQYRTNQQQAFCGKGALRNPGWLLHDAYGSPKIHLTINPTFCVALKGEVSWILIYVDYVDANGKKNTLSGYFYDIIKAKNTEQWNYGCYNLREYITAIIAGATQLVLRIFYIYGVDVLLDELYFGQQPTTSDTDDAHLRRLLCSPNGYRIIDVDVTKSQNSYDVTLNSAFAGHGFPLFAVDETQVPPDTNISFTRIASATAPISGTFDLTLRGQTLKSIPVDIGSDDITAILEQFDDIGVVQSGISDHPFNRYLTFTFDTYAGNLEQIHLNATLVGGINPTAYMHTVRDGEYRIDPLYGEMLQTAHGKHQVTVTINDVPSRCIGSCTYKWSSGSTPVINNITHVQELPYTTAHISGNGFSDNLSNNIVTIGGIICNVTMATSTLITCDIDNVTGGEHTVAVDVLGSGLAKYGDGHDTIFFSTQIDNIHPTQSGLGGSVNLSINGRGFSGNSIVTVGSKTCDILSVTTARIVCLLPPTSVAEVGSVTVQQNGVLSVMADKQFSYNESVTPRVTSISPESTRVLSGDTLIVIGDGFEANDTVTLLVGLAEINITFHNNSYLTASLPPCSSGSHPVKIIVGENGAALTSSNELPTITCTLEVTSVNPLSGSLFGGTQLTVTGSGFTPDVKVKVGTHECDVTSANDDQVICLIARTRNVHRVNNLGNHPAFGKYYYWSPQYIKVLVGDIVRWDWDFPFYITTMKPKVEETYNITTKYGRPGGFSSGVGTSSGSYSREFSKTGKFYYWSGIIDPYSTTWFHGSVEVVDRTSFLADVTVSLGNFEATYNIATTGQTPSTPDNTTCINPTDSRNNCSDPYPVQSTNSSKIPFVFWTCRTPVIEAVSRQNGTTNDEILISGDGFSGVSCANEVTFGDYLCESSSSSVSFLICNITVKNTPRVGRPQYLDFLVNGQGYAQVNLDSDLLKTFTLLPLVRFLSPTNGSRGGHTRLTISGTGFEDGNLSIMTEVTVGGYTCGIVSISYMQIVCLTPSSTSIGHREVIVVIQTASNTRIPANCDESCQFVYDDLVTPTVTDISPSIITGENTTLVTIVGTGFGDKTHNVNVSMTSLEEHDCLVINVSDSEIICSLTNLPLGLNQAVVDISDKGRALYTNGDVILTSLPTVSAILPKEGSIYGGTYVTVAGNGFSSDVTVQVGGQSCEVKNTTLKSLIFITPAILYGVKAVTIQANGVTFPVQTFNFTDNVSPKIFAVNPSSGTRDENITITGFNLGNTLNQTNIFVGASECRTTSVKDTEIKCTVGRNRAGTYNVYVNVHGFGDSNDDATFTFNMTAKSISPNSGSLAGDQTVTLSGTGFDDGMVVTICGDICYMSLGFTTDSAQYVCKTPHSLGSFSKNCTVQVSVNGVVETLLDAYTYDDATTPVVDYLTPKRGGTAGGTRITIFGSNFGSTQVATFDCTSSVTIAGTLCNITSWTNTQVVCVTEAHSRSDRAVVRLETGCNGKANETNAGFHFVDVWSSAYTWGGTDLGLPTAGDIVVIQKGQTILLDTDTPVLKMLLIQGGELVFDEEDVELQAENILITDGGLLQVGTEAVPFQHKAVITLHGHVGSKELPIYGTKSLIVREGTLDLHGAHVPITWTKLATSAAVGDTQITLQHKVTWQKGDTILITTTGGINSQYESETATITSIAMNRTITLNSPLTNQHHGISEFVEGRELNFSAEVGLLTRNIVIRGFKDSSQVTACPDGFDPGYFEVSTCFQGRQEGGNRKDQFGAHVIIHTTDQTKQLTTSRIEFVEFVHVGQAFRLGRHPINFHMTGDMSKSYVRGCGIHDTFNRAINIRDTHNLLVERNVIYNVNGAAIYLEDGTETGNLFQYNLGVLVKGSSQLLNDDISAATFWITNPNNTFRHNVAAGGTHFGYWIYLENIAISSLTGRHRPQYTPLGEFNNNTAHSLGWYGLWIYPIYTPRVMYAFDSFSSSRKAAVINNMYVWNCRKGIEIADMGAIHIRGLIAVNNVYAGYEGKMVVEGNQYTDDGPLVENSLIVGYVPSMPSQGCTNGGVVSPYKFGFTIRNVSFVNFDQPDCSALTITRIPEQCGSLCGGYMYRTQNLTFTNVDSRVRNDWIWESVYEDMDGSLCGYDLCKVVPCTKTLPTMCTIFSQNATSVPLCTCPSEVKLFRFAINPFTYSISATTYQYSEWPLLLTNKYGTTQHQYRYNAIDPSGGWMTNFVSGESYQSKFNVVITLTNITYNGYIYRMQYGDYVKISQPLIGEPDKFRIDGYNLIPATNETLDPDKHYHGDWQYNETSGMLTYLVSYRRRGYQDTDYGSQDIDVNLRIEKCFFKGCVTPPISEATTPQTPVFKYWSSPSSWPNNTLPKDLDDVVIAEGTWIIADTAIPRLNKLVIYGVLEFNHGPVNDSYRNFTLSATDILIFGGRLLIGSPSDPFLGQLDIVLRGRHLGFTDTQEYLPNTQIAVNSKSIGVYGGLFLHGKDVGIAWTRLITTGSPGDTTITLVENVTWGVGEEIVIAPTSYDIWETEIFKITGVSDDGITLSLNDSLQFRHIVNDELISGQRIIMAAEVGILTRNIRVFGENEEVMYKDGYGARIQVGTTVINNTYYQGYASFGNVEFFHTGQYRYSLFPHYPSLTYRNVGTVTEDKSSFVTKCTFHHGFSSAVGVYGTNSLVVTENVMHHSVLLAIETQSFRTTIRRNLVVLVSGSSSRFGAISGMGSKELTLTDNSVSGTNGVAFHVPGVECGLTSGPSGNEAHSSSIGLAVFPGDNVQGSCYQVSNYFIWKCYDIAIYYNNRLSVVLINNTMAENTLGIYNQIIGPSAAAHLYAAKQCTVKDSIIIGTTSSYNCTTDQAKSTGISSQITGGHVGLVFASFMQGSNSAPFYGLTGIRNYPAIMGIMNVEGVTFAHFKTVCGTKDVMLTTNKANDDGQHPVVTRKITKYNSENDSSFFIHRPNIEKINPRDCVDMDCDGLKKALIRDEDGTFLGTIGSVLSQSEWEWNGDPNRGLADYRIPLEMLTTLTGERINVSSIAPHKGIIRTDQCIYRAAWQAYECHDLDYKMLIIESLDADTETRRLSPVAVLGDGYLDLINGPQDHSGCRIGNCRKRLSTFMAIVATGKHYLLHFTTTSPQTLRFFLLNSNDNQVVTLGIWYSQSNRRDVYVNDELVLAKNARMVNGKYVVDPPSSPGEFVPATDSSDVTGTNFFDRDSNILYVLVRGSSPVKIVTNPSFIVSFQIPALTAEEFYGEALIHNLALFFDVPPEKIRVVNVVRESGRRRRRRRRDVAEDMEIQFEISDPPKTDGNATENETLTTESLLNISSKFINEVQGGKDLSKALNVTISSIAVSEPLPEVREDGEYIIEDSDGKLTIPKSMNITIQPSASYETVQFPTQPSLKVYDEQDQPMTKLGSIGDPWQMTAYLISGANLSATLHGTTTVDVVGGWANFTDLTVSHYGNDFCLHFNKTYPINEKHLSTQSDTFSVAKLEVALSNNISTEPLVMNNATEMRINLIDNTTRHRVSDIAWRGHNWTATVSLVNASDTTGNMSGSLQAIFDPDTGEAVFDSLTFDQIGLYFLTFHVTSSPEEYDINDNVQVQVVNEKQFALLNDNTTIVTNITVTFEENYQQIVGDNEASFGAMIANIFAQQNPDVLLYLVSVKEGSIVVRLAMRSQAGDINSTVESIYEIVKSGNFNFNGENLKSPELRVNEIDVSSVTTTTVVPTSMVPKTTAPDTTTTTAVTTTSAVDVTTTTPVTTTTTPVTTTTTLVTTTTTVDTTTTPPVTTTTVDITTTTPVTTTTTPVTTTTTVDTTTTPPVSTTTVDITTTTPVTTTTTPVTTTTTVDTTTTPPITTTTVDITTTTPVTKTTTVDTTTTQPVTTTTTVDTTATPPVTTTAVDSTTTSPADSTTTTEETSTSTPVASSATTDTTTTTLLTTTTVDSSKSSYKNSGMSVPTLIVIVTTPSVLLAGIVVIFLIIKCNRLRHQDAREQLTRKDSSMVADNFHTTENQQGRNEYPYSSPFSITNNMKSYQTQLPRIQTNSVLRSVTPTITPSNFAYLGVGDNGHSSRTFYTGKQQNRFN